MELPACGTTTNPTLHMLTIRIVFHTDDLDNYRDGPGGDIHSQTPIEFWGEAVNTAVCLHQLFPNESLKRNDRDGYLAPYETPHTRWCTHSATYNARNKISY